MKLCITLTILLLLTPLATSVAAEQPGASQVSDDTEAVHGVATLHDVERLSYVSPSHLGIRPSYDTCIKRTQGVVPRQQDCAEAELAYQDARLNRAYKALLARLSKIDALDRKAAIEAQRAWLGFRDKDCPARAGRFGSNAGPTTLSICMMRSTAYRAQQLEDWLGSVERRPLE